MQKYSIDNEKVFRWYGCVHVAAYVRIVRTHERKMRRYTSFAEAWVRYCRFGDDANLQYLCKVDFRNSINFVMVEQGR